MIIFLVLMDNNIDYTVADNNDCFVAKVDFIMNDNNLYSE